MAAASLLFASAVLHFLFFPMCFTSYSFPSLIVMCRVLTSALCAESKGVLLEMEVKNSSTK